MVIFTISAGTSWPDRVQCFPIKVQCVENTQWRKVTVCIFENTHWRKVAVCIIENTQWRKVTVYY